MNKITRLTSWVAILFLSQSAFAQFNQVWLQQYQHTSLSGYSNEGRRIAEDPSGNIFVMADVTSDIDPLGIHNTGLWHYLALTKYSTNGVMLGTIYIDIQRHLGAGFDNLGAFGLEVDASGNVYAGYITWNSISDFDVALAKFDNDLIRIWANTYGTNGVDEGVDMAVHSNGTIYAIVKSTQINTEYSIIESVPNSAPANLLYSYNPNGPAINSIDVDAQHAYVGGYSVKGSYKNALVEAFDLATGSRAWSSVYSPPGIMGDDEVIQVTVGADGNIYSVGTSYQDAFAGTQVLVMKNLANNPRLDFVAFLGSNGVDDNGLHIDAAESGWIYLGSVSGIYSIIYRIPDDGIFTTPSKAIFAPEPGSPYNSIDKVTFRDMKVSSSKNVYLTGGVIATDNSGQFSSCYLYKASVVFGNALVKAGGMTVEGSFDHNLEGIDLSLDYAKSDVYLLRNFWDDAHNSEVIELMDVNVPSPLREIQSGAGNNNLFNVSIVPNPAKNRITIDSDADAYSIEVMDITGSLVLSVPENSGRTSVDVSSLLTGVYFCKVRTAEGESIHRLVIN